MQRALILAIIGTFLTRAAVAQKDAGAIEGMVRDSVSNEAMENATVNLFLLGPSGPAKLFAVRRNGPRGFLFRGLSPGEYRIVSTYLGYRPDTIRVSLGAAGTARIRLMMQRSDSAMVAVVVTARIPPANVRHDTIAFNTSAYPLPPNATLEDLLRKLPGIEIDKDGNVTMQGKKVDKVYIDGKVFFLGDPRIATQKLPAEIIDQVEVFDTQSDLAKMAGIKEMSGAKTLNIRLKRNRRQGYVGKLYAGTGSGAAANPQSLTGSYTAGGDAMMLGKTQIMASGNVNNLNDQFVGTDRHSGAGGAGRQQLNSLELDLAGPQDPPLPYTINAGSSGNRTVLDEVNTTQTALTDSSLLSHTTSRSNSSGRTWHGDGYLRYQPDSLLFLSLTSDWTGNSSNINRSDSTTLSTLKGPDSYTLNRGQTANTAQTTNFHFNNMLILRQRLRSGGMLVIDVRQTSDRNRQPQTTLSELVQFDSAGRPVGRTQINQVIGQTSHNDDFVSGVYLDQRLDKVHSLIGNYEVDRSVGRSDRSSNDYDSVTGAYDKPDATTSNHFTTTSTTQRVSMAYNITTDKLVLQAGLTSQFMTLDNLNRSNDSLLRIRQTAWYPLITLLYTPGKGQSINFVFSTHTTIPTLQQLQPVTDPTNPFLVHIGNPKLEQTLTRMLTIYYSTFDAHNAQNWQLGLNGSFSDRAIVPSTTILAGGIQQQGYVNAGGVWNASAVLSYGFPVGDQKKANASVGLTGQYGRGVNFVNGTQNVVYSPGGGLKGKLNLHPIEELYIDAQGSVKFTSNRYSANPAQNTTGWVQGYSLQARYTLPGAVTISSYYSIQWLSGTLPAPPVSLWDAGASKELGRKRAFELRLDAFGLLNNAQNINQVIAPGVLSTTQSEIPGRILLLSLLWHFKKFS
ncbi:MAG: outer membrane beta-barrel protein [Bacteroidota bacterium]|nr:outer membrane beta-barrel protein [Bacteroidota bacterium]